MPAEPQIKQLSDKARGRFFWSLVLIFLCSLPVMVFYTTGYRLNLDEEAESMFITTGGIYVTTSDRDADVYLDEKRVEHPRLFRSAYYIQNVSAGQHRLVVQQPERTTWVKELHVDSHIVTEVISFNMPEVPQLRPITQYRTATDTAVFIAATSTEVVPAYASSTEPFVYIESTSTVPLVESQEYVYVERLFTGRSSTTEPLRSVFETSDDTKFRFANNAPTSTATTSPVLVQGDMELFPREGELYVRWLSSDWSIPFYFCVSSTSPGVIAKRYGTHVRDAMFDAVGVATSSLITTNKNQLCRTEIKLDRQWQDVYWYDFMPEHPDLVLMLRADGLYVTEIDDRSWQNSQLLYRGDDIRVTVASNTIYLYENEHYFEIVTEIEEQ